MSTNIDVSNMNSCCLSCSYAKIHIFKPLDPEKYEIQPDEDREAFIDNEAAILRIYCPEFEIYTSDGEVMECNSYDNINKKNLLINKGILK